MSAHQVFDQAIERYVEFNNAEYTRSIHVMRITAVVDAGIELLRGYGITVDEPEPAPDTLREAATWALQYFANTDVANAAIHCSPVRYSPITFRLAEALSPLDPSEDRSDDVRRVMQHLGLYEEDRGR